MALLDEVIVRALPVVPRTVVRRISSRYIAGTTLGDACRVVARLNGQGRLATVDVLGEAVKSADEARSIATSYRDVLDAIQRERLDANVSVKLTALGLTLDRDLCRENLEAVVADAGRRSSFVRIDMEDSSTTDAALELYRELRGGGHDNVGVVLQARLRRTLDDVRGLADLTPNVRLCKGIYLEPAGIAHTGEDEIRESFLAALDLLLAQGSYVGIATHDERLLGESLRLLGKHGRTHDRYEFQFLLGVRPERAGELIDDGNRLRVYVPFGARWYEYSLRRLQENPKVAGYIAADVVGQVLGSFESLARGRQR